MTDLAPFVGRFHPLLVHLPIGMLVLAGVLQLLAWRRRRDVSVLTPVIVFGAASAVLSALTGYLLGTSGGYAGDTFTWHELLGISVAIGATVTAIAAVLRDKRTIVEPPSPSVRTRRGGQGGEAWHRVYAVSLTVTLAMLVVAGHLGATLTHGEDYLTEHAPAPIRALLARVGIGSGDGRVAAAAAVDQALVYASLVEPVLRERCVACHGAAKAEGGLRLDTPEGLRRGGQDGAVFTAGRAASSDLVRRLWLPASHKDVMPPRGQRPLMPAEAALIRWWIDQGAKFDQKVVDAEMTPDVRPAIEAMLGPIDRGGPTLPRVTVAEADPAAIAKLRESGVSVVSVAAGTPFLHVHCTNVRATFGDARLAALEPLSRQLLWLDLSGTRVTDAGLAVVARFPNLTRLHLNGTAVTDAGLAQLTRLDHLEYLNLYATRITDDGLTALAGLKNLRALYVWQTAVTSQGVERLRTALPRVKVEAGLATPPATN